VFSIYLEIKSKIESNQKVLHSKLHLIDLAGSERTKKTGSEGIVLKEASDWRTFEMAEWADGADATMWAVATGDRCGRCSAAASFSWSDVSGSPDELAGARVCWPEQAPTDS